MTATNIHFHGGSIRLRLATFAGVVLATGMLATGILPADRGAQAAADEILQPGPLYTEMCDASAAVAVGSKGFLIASDEDNVLRAYRRDKGGAAAASFDMTSFLEADPDHPECDIEGATWLGERIFWITSHGRNKVAKKRPNRRRLFATRFKRDGEMTVLRGDGRPYKRLLDDLTSDPRLEKYNLAKASKKAPKDKDGLNIEGLAATPDGRLLIGFRNPLVEGKALVVPLLNPIAILKDKRAKLGEPIELDLAGLGIRSIEYFAGLKKYIIVAGAYDKGEFRLLLWSGRPNEKPTPIPAVKFGKLNPEAFIIYPAADKNRFQIFSDDGTLSVGGKPCKTLQDPAQQSFRSAWLTRLPADDNGSDGD